MTDMPNYDASDMPNGDPPPAPPEINKTPAENAAADSNTEHDEEYYEKVAANDRAMTAEVAAHEDERAAQQYEDDSDPDPSSVDIDEIIETAVGVSMEAFTRRHPTTARYLIRRLGDPLEFTIKALKEDELYQQLIADTEEALDVRKAIQVIVSVALSVAERLLVTL